MQHLLPLDPTLGFAVGLGFAFLILLSLEIYNSRRVNKLTYPAYEYAQKKAEEEANRILEEARAQAHKIVSDAEIAGLALSETRKKEGESASRAYEASLRDLMHRLEAQLQQSIKQAEESQAKLSTTVVSQLESEGKEARAHMSESIAKIETEYRKRMEEELNAALAAAKTDAEGYAKLRKAAIDEHIVALIGETLRVVLQKNLPKDFHAEFARAALEEAKASGIF